MSSIYEWKWVFCCLEKVERVSIYSRIFQIPYITLCIYYHSVIKQQVNTSDKYQNIH